ncbi:MAG TPA: MBL fold metallo-hydrolase [Dehalococcoidia bacterium]|jgi:glyoxylase-like metal-dependent hydrolase (beta-lactamase superfamily II)|nr:MBL fold metallo-hydrolase [Dehalococcoidia bacterium]
MILKKLVVGPLASNCYILGSESSKEGIIIDPADEAERLEQTIKELGLKIKLIVLTHGHPDHIGALRALKEATGAEVAIHADDAQSLRQQVLAFLFGFSFATPPAPDRLLKGGDSIDISDLHFSVIHTPGHTPGSICLLGHGVLFSGDTLFNYGIGRYDLPGGDYQQLMDSLQTKLMVLPDDTLVYPGHGPDTTIGAERRGNPFLHG